MYPVENAIDYLMEEAGTAIKYRVVREFYNDTSTAEYFELKQELENSKRAKKLQEYLINRKEYHGATLWAVENSLNMLIDMGFKYETGFEEFDMMIKRLAWEVQHRKVNENHILRQLPDIVVMPFLLRAGIRNTWMVEFVKERMAVIHSFVKEKSYDIYDDISLYKGMPKSFQGRPVILPKLYKNGQIRLPLEYDIYAMSCLYTELSQDYKDRIIYYG